MNDFLKPPHHPWPYSTRALYSSTPVSGSRRRSGRGGTGAGTPGSSNGGGGDSDDYDSSSDGEEVSSSYLTNIGRVVWAENTDKKSKNKEAWFPALIVAPSASDTVKIDTKEEFLIRSFKDGRYYTVSKKDTNRFHKESAKKSDKELVREGEIGATDCKKCPLKQIIFVSWTNFIFIFRSNCTLVLSVSSSSH